MKSPAGKVQSTFDPEVLLEKASKLNCSQAEVYQTVAASTPVNYDNNRLKSMETAQTAVVAVRVIKDGRLGFATSTRPGDTEVVDMAARAAEFGPDADLDFAPGSPVRDDLEGYDEGAASWPQEEMLAAGGEMVETLAAMEDGVLASATVEKVIGSYRVTTSGGQDVSNRATGAVVFGGAELVEPDNMIHAFGFRASRRLDIDFRGLTDHIVWLYRNARRNVPMRGGSYQVIFSPMAGMDLISPMAACLDGKAVVKGESPWKDRVGDKLFSDEVALIDDPTLPWGIRTTPFDDEGVPTQKRALIENGVLKDFYLDLRTAKALGRASTGNGFRPNPQAMPAPRTSNLTLVPGAAPLSDLIAGIKEGLYVERLMGAWAGNPYAGQVSGNIHIGFRIENGEMTGRVKDCMLSVSVFDAFRDHLLALSREVEVSMAMYRLPYILLDKVSVSTKA
ncbi:MAG: TldD/PmbA family protein [Bacillota bacterium]|nr:MAG: TldD/PmbA family protein [Bacillota bacterium]